MIGVIIYFLVMLVFCSLPVWLTWITRVDLVSDTTGVVKFGFCKHKMQYDRHDGVWYNTKNGRAFSAFLQLYIKEAVKAARRRVIN